MISNLIDLENPQGKKIRVATHVRDASLPGHPIIDNPRLARLKDAGFKLASQRSAASHGAKKDPKGDPGKVEKKKS